MTAKEWLPICLTHGAEQPPLMRTVTLIFATNRSDKYATHTKHTGYMYYTREAKRYWNIGGIHIPHEQIVVVGWYDDFGSRQFAWGD